MAISDNTMAVDDTESNHSQGSESDNDVPNFNERTRKRRRNIKGKQRSTASYEIESIIGHIKENDAYLFQVKWIGCSNEDNSWLSIDMFNQKDLLKAHIEKHNLGIL
ncbi:hypothetical protein INT45_002789 [Circinella minor]|uniref:Chromo domain-containing protein n=1 Tax=Circinella minor TaxID=1195481 RepID=A0A8H7VFZ5_9FUNG|nr:hypothetical protein INT45_002789 [Circinella minor]